MKNKKFRFMFSPHRRWYTLFLVVYCRNVNILAPTEKAAIKKFRRYFDEDFIRIVRT